MTSLESIERLRGLATDVNKSEIKDHDALYSLDQWLNAWHRAFGKALEALEREIAEKYMELPVDADGVPIHVYDRLLKSTGAQKPTYGEVVGISDDSVFFSEKQGWSSNWASLTRHVKPDKLKERVNEFLEAYDASLASDEQIIRAFCADIREMAKEGEL